MKRFNVAKALKNDEKMYKPIEKVVAYVFYELIYKPIFEIVKEEIGADWLGLELPKVMRDRVTQKKDDLRAEIERNREVYSYLYKNSKENNQGQNPLIRAILSGQVQYIRDHFEGTFNIYISRAIKEMGGTFDKRSRTWRIPREKLTPQVSIALGTSYGKMAKVKERIDGHLEQLRGLMEKDPQFGFEKAYGKAIAELGNQFEKGSEGIIVAPEFTTEMAKGLAEKYTYNMNLYIKGWTEKSIVRLRERVAQSGFQGNRASTLVKGIETDFQVSLNKAKFLARQETSLLMSQYREERYKSAGVQKYRWITAGDVRVRGYHKRLNGKIFTWDNPPVVDATGHRAHPGQDYNCRCICVPIVD